MRAKLYNLSLRPRPIPCLCAFVVLPYLSGSLLHDAVVATCGHSFGSSSLSSVLESVSLFLEMPDAANDDRVWCCKRAVNSLQPL